MGQGDLAAEMVEKALADRPDFLEGYLHLAIVYVRTGRSSDAAATIEDAVRRFPAQEPQLRELWRTIRESAAADSSAETSDPHPPVAPASGGGSAAQAPPAADPEGVSGTVYVAPGLGSHTGGVLFVMLRRDGAEGGPPLAARRIVVSSFPVTFRVGAADSMMGEALPDSLRVEARLDTDGDPTTKPPSDPTARRDGVRKGTSGMTLVLDRP
jgi:hypothetical protein